MTNHKWSRLKRHRREPRPKNIPMAKKADAVGFSTNANSADSARN
jgi:hypothetical protein